jgi:PAS domain S-box-containing protein
LRDPDRQGFEQRLGHAIVTPGAQHKPAPRASSYLPTALVSGFPPLNMRGVDLRREPGLLTALHRALFPGNAGATPIAASREGTSGLFLVARAPNVIDGILRPGFVALFVSETTVRAAAKNAPGLRLSTISDPSADFDPGRTVREEFTVAGQQFSVVLPKKSVSGASAILPWLILAGGLVLVAATTALGANASRRAKAQADLDRLFTLSPDVITVADFEGWFTRVNPAAERVLGYTVEELLERPYLDFVHPDDREKTAAEAAALGAGSTTLSFENRYVRKDGTQRVLEWTATPVVRDRLMYGVARDVTERRKAETDLRKAEERNRMFAEEQAALRRVATLVAEGATDTELFAGVAREVAQVLGVRIVSIDRYESDVSSTVVASVDDPGFPVGSRWPLDGPSLGATVLETGRPARVDDYTDLQSASAAAARAASVTSTVGVPIVVDGRVWGVICVGTGDPAPLAADTEERLAAFTEIVATGIADAESRAALARLANQQAALRRVATRVAEGVSPAEVFSAVSEEIGRLFGTNTAGVTRFDHDGPTLVFVGVSKHVEAVIPIGTRWQLDDAVASAEVYRTGRSARADAVDWSAISGPVGPAGRRLGAVSTVASPIIVEGCLWGTATVSASEPLPADADDRLEKFTELLATAIANAESSAELAASRRRIVAASDDARRRIERDLHDGTQQRLVSLGLALRAAEAEVPPELDELRAKLSSTASGLAAAVEDLQEISRGIHPAILSRGGLVPALETLAGRAAVPVALAARIDRGLPESVQVAAYYVVSEALTNAAKHANASRVDIEASVRDGSLRLSVRDDGVGGAEPARGSGLVGLRDRVEAVGGSIEITSPPGHGTHVVVQLPVELD